MFPLCPCLPKVMSPQLPALILALVTVSSAFGQTPPTISWIGPGGGNWNNANNWSPARVPLATDHVEINTSSNVTVTLDVSASIASLTLGADSGTVTQRLAFNSGVGLSVATNSVVRGRGEMQWPNGDYSALSGAGLLEIGGLLDWAGGTMSSRLRIAAGGRMRLGGGNYMRLTSGNGASPAVITNAGTVTWLGGLQLYADDNAQIYNSGRWELAAEGLAFGHCCSGAAATFYNSGTLVKTGGVGTSYMNSFSLVNSGIVAADVGTLELQSGVGSEWLEGGQIAGTGRVLLSGGSATLAGRTTLNGQWEWNSDGLNVHGTGEVGGPVPLDWTAGQVRGALTIAADGVLSLRGGLYMRLSSGTSTNPAALTNHGVIIWAGGQRFLAYDGAQVHNFGEWRIEADGLVFEQCCSGDWPTFYNHGLITKTAGTGTSALGNSLTIQSGTVNADMGTLQFNGNSQWPEGARVTGAGRVLMASGNASLAGTTTLNGSWEWGGASISGTGMISGPVPLVWRAGQQSGQFTINPGAQLSLSGEFYPWLYSGDDAHPAILTNRGTVTWPGGMSLYGGTSAQIYNYGLWRLEADGTALQYTGGGAYPTFHNFGTLAKTGGTNETVFIASTTINHGTVHVASGSLQFNTASTWTDGGQITGAGRVWLNGGSTTVSGTTTLNGSWQWSNVSISGTNAISGPVPLVWRSGRHYGKLTVNPGAQLHFSGEFYPWLSSGDDAHPAILTNRGTVTWPGGNSFYGGAGAQIYNDGQWRLEADGTALQHTGGGAAPTFHNLGTLSKTGGTNETIVTTSSTINHGTMSVAVGTLQFNASTEWRDGGQITGSGRVLLNGSSTLLSGTTLLNGSWQWQSVSVAGTGAITGPIPLTWRTGQLYGNLTVASDAQLNFSGEFYPLLSSGNDASPAILTNRGTVVWPGGSFYAGTSARIYNFGQWRLEGGGTPFIHTSGGGWGTFFNNGTLLKTSSATADLTSFYLVNSGRLTAEAGQFNFNTPPQNSGEFHFPVSGPVAGTDFGVLRIAGAYSHQGTLHVELMNGFTPALGQSFDVVTGTALSGNFAALALPALPPDQGWTVDYVPTLARLRLADKCFADGLVGWWTADSGASDLTGAHNGVLVNDATTTNGFVGQAFFLDGLNDYVDLGAWSAGTRWTIQAWVNLSQIQSGRRNILGGVNEDRDWALTAVDGCLGLTYRSLGGVSTTFTHAAPALTNTWYHLAGTGNGSNVAFYLNGALVGTAPSDPDYAPTTTGLRIGSASYAVAENVAGLVDEATVHNRPLTASEIAATYNNGAGGRCAQLGLGVLAFTPSGFATSDVSQLRIIFNQPFQTNTFTGTDVAITGPAGAVANHAFTVQPATPYDGRTFLVNMPALTNDGAYRATLGPDVLTLAGLPMPAAYTATFTLDKSGPRVIAFTPTSPVSSQVTVLEATFSEAISGASVLPSDVTITGAGSTTVSSVSQIASNVVRFQLNRPLGQGAHVITLGPAITDLAGNAMDQNEDATNGTPIVDAFSVTLSVETPDLVPLAPSSPAFALAGQATALTYTVTNAGAAPAPGGWRARFWLASDSAGSSSVFLGDALVTNVVAPQASLLLTQSLLLPPGITGIRYLGVQLDARDEIVESDETNNLAYATSGVAVSAPDLAASGVAVPASATLGTGIHVGWTRQNIGSASTFVAGQDRIFLGTSAGSTLGARWLATVPGTILAAGASNVLSQSVRIPLETSLPPGNYFILVAVDSPDAQPESDETNNLAAAAITLNRPALPDLAATDFSPPSVLFAGSSMDTRWIVTNTGTLSLTNAVWHERISFTNSTVGRVTLAEFEFTNSLAIGGFLARTQTVFFPDSLPALPGWLLLSVDQFDNVVELSEANNLAWTDAPVPVQPGLHLSLSSETLAEGASAIQGTVRRNGDTTEPLVVSLTNDQPARLVITNRVVIPADAESASFALALPGNGHIDGTVYARIGVHATNYSGDVALLSLVDLTSPALSLTLGTNRVLEGLTVPATVSRGVPGPEELVVFIGLADPLSLTVPFSVTIPSNQADHAFAVLANDDTYFNGTRSNVVRAAATGYTEALASLAVLDDDLPTVTLELSPSTVLENAGPQAANLTARISAPVARNVVLDLLSSDPAHARVPVSISIPSGQTAASVPIAVIDNQIMSSNAPVDFQGFLHESGSTRQLASTAPVTLFILDDESAALNVELDRDLVAEGLAPATAGTVTRNGSTAAALVVTLASSDATEATVLPTVTIPAGQSRVPFDVDSIDDGVTDGAQHLTVTASAAGFTPGSAPLTVSDQDLPDLRVARLTGPTSAQADTFFTLSYRVENQGRVACGSNLLTKIHLRTDPLAFGGTALAGYTLPSALPPGQFFEQSLQGHLPSKVGRYYLVAQTDPDGQFTETLEDNNTLVSAPIDVTAPWTVTVQTTVDSAPAGTPIPMTGTATRAGGQPVGNALVSIHVKHNGTRRDLAAFTDANGDFATTFTPFATEAGFYEIAASYPGVEDLPAQDAFTLLGLSLSPVSSQYTLKEGGHVSGVLSVSNLSSIALPGLAVSLVSQPSGWNTTVTLTDSALPGDGTNALHFAVTPNSTGIGTLVVRVTATGGVSADAQLVVAVEPLRPRFVLEPASLFVGMVRGQQTLVNVELANLGGATSGPVNVSLPTLPWLSVASPNPMPALGPNETNVITLLLSPPADLDLIPFEGAILIEGGNASINVPFQFRALSEAKGDLTVSVVDELTYYAEGAPRVTNALVTLRDPLTHDPITNLVTGADGSVFFPALTEGYYEVDVRAEQHTGFRGNTFVAAGRSDLFEPFISRNLVEYVWTVVPTEIEDRTRIVIETTFETVVPLPVVTVEPAYIDLSELPDGESQIDIRISNHGLIAAQDVSFELPTEGGVKFESIVRNIGALPANSSITVPVLVRQPVDTLATRTKGTVVINQRDRCYYYGYEKHVLICGKQTNTYSTPVSIRDPKAEGCDGQGGGGGGGGGGGSVMNGGMLMPYGTTSGPGGTGFFVASRTIEEKEKCGCEDFVPECWEIGGSIGLPELKLAGASASVKASGSFKRCSCCDEDGRGTKDETSASLEGALEFKVRPPSAGVEVSFSSGGFDFKGEVALGGPELVLSPKLTGQYTATEDCHGKNKRTCKTASAETTVELISKLGPEFTVKQNGRYITKATAQASVSLKGGVSAKIVDCNDGTPPQYSVCIGPVVASASISVSGQTPEGVQFGGGAAVSRELIPEKCTSTSGRASPAGAGAGPEEPNLADQVAEVMRLALDEAVARFENERRLPSAAQSQTASAATRGGLVVASAAGGSDGICAHVKLRIEQDLVMARNAFDATLELINRDSATPLTDVLVDVSVADVNGHDATDRFGFRPPAVSGMSAVDGTGVLAANSSGRASFILVPTSEAAPEGPTTYFVRGTLGYSMGGLKISVPLIPAPITVYPDPRLHVKYFHQRDVLSDDPFTRDVIEPTIPYSLAVMVENAGKGVAKNVRIISGQPKIVENEKGLLIDFKIIATEVAGKSLTPSLTAEFGTIEPGDIGIGRWLLTSTLQGLFIDYHATFEHLDSLGKTNLSLIDEVSIHEMIRLVQAGGRFEDGKPDFLVNEEFDPEDMPDHLYLSDGTTNDVSVVRQARFDAPPAAGDLSVTLTAHMPAGWGYLLTPDPANSAFQLARVIRSDGVEIVVNTNVWVTDRTFVGHSERPIRENRLHLLDDNSTGTYTLLYSPLPPTDYTAPDSAVTALPTYSGAQIPVSWEGTDAGGGSIAFFDLYVADNYGPFLPWLQEAQQRAAIYTGMPGHRYEFYSVATDNSGNREAPPIYADTQTVITLSNTAPTLSLDAPAVIDEGQTLIINSLATEPDAPLQSLLFTLAAGPAGASINPATGRIQWFTGEGSGPSTNLFRVLARDNGLPPLSATNQVSVIVREVNSPPVLSQPLLARVNEGVLLLVTNAAADPDLPANTLSWSLGPTAPNNASINAAGVFAWRPTAIQGPSTNQIPILVTDNGVPPMSATQVLAVVVRDSVPDVSLALGTTNLFGGESNSVPVTVATTLDLSETSFLLQTDLSRLTSLALGDLGPEVISASLLPVDGTSARVWFQLNGNAPDTVRTLASLCFQTATDGRSAQIPLRLLQPRVHNAAGERVANVAAADGAVFLINQEPILVAGRQPQRSLTIYGHPGETYAIEQSATLASGWSTVVTVTLTLPKQTVPLPDEPGSTFYRARRVQSLALHLELSGSVATLGWPSNSAGYIVQFTPSLAPLVDWQTLPGSPFPTNGTFQLTDTNLAGTAGFYRLVKP